MCDTRIAVVTGANRGIGLAIVRALLKQRPEWMIVLTSRDPVKGQKAVEELNKEGFNRVEYRQLDVSSKESIASFKEYCKDMYPQGLTALVNNAGVFLSSEGDNCQFDQDKCKKVCEVNYLAVYNLVSELSDVMAKTSRIVMVSSRGAQMAFMKFSKEIQEKWKSIKTFEELHDIVLNEFCNLKPNENNQIPTWFTDDLNGKIAGYGWPHVDFLPYGVSKLGVNVLTQLFQEKFEKEGKPNVLLNSCTPGAVHTDMNPQATRTVEEGADVPVYLCCLPNDSTIRGMFLDAERKPVDPFTL